MKTRRIYELTKEEEFIIGYALHHVIYETEKEIKSIVVKTNEDKELIEQKENGLKKFRELYDQFK